MKFERGKVYWENKLHCMVKYKSEYVRVFIHGSHIRFKDEP